MMDAYTLDELQAHQEHIAGLLLGVRVMTPAADAPSYFGATEAAVRCALSLFDAEIARRQQAALLTELAEVVK